MGRDFTNLEKGAGPRRGPRAFVSLRRFMEIWNKATSPAEVAKRTGYTLGSCMAMASELRYLGYKLQNFARRIYD